MTPQELNKRIEAVRAKLPVWSVYMLINNAKKEIYVGVSRAPEERIYADHASGSTKAISHWNFTDDQILAKLVKQHLNQSDASSYAHSIEQMGNVDGFKIIQTAGI